jgi:hypothetical protein
MGLSVRRCIPPRCVLGRLPARDQDSFFRNSGRRRSGEELGTSFSDRSQLIMNLDLRKGSVTFPGNHANSIRSHAYHIMGWSYRMVRNWRITLVRKTGMSSRSLKQWIIQSTLIRSPGCQLFEYNCQRNRSWDPVRPRKRRETVWQRPLQWQGY